jgi:hypothetical protein
LRKTQNTEKIGHFLEMVLYFDQYLNKNEGLSDDIITFLVFTVAILLDALCSGSRVPFPNMEVCPNIFHFCTAILSIFGNAPLTLKQDTQHVSSPIPYFLLLFFLAQPHHSYMEMHPGPCNSTLNIVINHPLFFPPILLPFFTFA